MSQNTGLRAMELGAGAPITIQIEPGKDVVKSIQDCHAALRNVVLSLLTGGFSVSQSSDNPDTGRPAASTSGPSSAPVATFQPNAFYNEESSHLPGHTVTSFQSVNCQFIDYTPKSVQRTVSFMLSELRCEWEQSRQRNFHQKTLMKKHYTYLVQCRRTAEKEKKAAQDLLSKAIAALQAAEQEREKCANERIMALQELRFVIRRRQFNLLRPTIPKSVSTTSSVSSVSSDPSESSLFGPCNLPLVPASHKFCLPTPPKTPFNSDFGYESELARSVTTLETSNGMSGEKQTEGTFFEIPFQSAKGDTLQNPIGPYLRSPMSIEDMQKCIRCLLGKDKSLKTGNRARAFLGVPWSEIVSWDPEILLQRGVCGIKPGSTGMASRLRMMTIIESALANLGNDTVTEEIWERPTHFCQRCQERYPITVRSDEAVPVLDKCGAESRLQIPTFIDKLDMEKKDVKARNKRHQKKLDGLNA